MFPNKYLNYINNCTICGDSLKRDLSKCYPSPLITKTSTCNPTPVILIADLTNFDDFTTLILLAKEPSIDLRLIIVDYGFGNIGPCINNVYYLLSWLHDNKTPVLAGTYFSDEEIEAGPFPDFASDNPSVNATRRGQIAQPLFQMFIPPLWRDNSSTLFGVSGKIPSNRNPYRQYSSVDSSVIPIDDPVDRIETTIEEIKSENKKVVIFNTGSLNILDKYFNKNQGKLDDVIDKIIIMGGGFYNFEGPEEDRCSQRWAGNIFSERTFYMSSQDPIPNGYAFNNPSDWENKPLFTTMQEFNIFIAPRAAKSVFAHVYENKIEALLIPMDATHPILIETEYLEQLKSLKTYEGRFVGDMIQGIKDFEGPDFDFVIRLWDILATLAFLNPEIIENSVSGSVDVVQLGSIDSLKRFKCNEPNGNPYNCIQFNPYVGQTIFTEVPNSSLKVVFKMNGELSKKILLNRLNDPINTATEPPNY